MNNPTEIHAIQRYFINDHSGNRCFCCKIKEMHHGYADYRLHNYDELKIVRIEHGSCVWNVNGSDYEMESGDLLLLNRLDFRYVRKITSAEPMSVCQLCFTPSALYPNQDAARFFFCRPDGLSNHLSHKNLLTKELAKDFDSILEEIDTVSLYRDEMILNRLSRMILHIAREYPAVASVHRNPDNSSLIADVVTYIRENPCADLSLSAMAARASMSKSHFSRTFKAYSGIGLREYITRSRVIRVITMMKNNPKCNIIDIALACGFNTSSGFYRAFESVTGTSPRSLFNSETDEAKK